MAREDDALTLVMWFEEQPAQQTVLRDEAIAVQLRWFRGNFTEPTANGRNTPGGKNALGDRKRVKNARDFVDRHNKVGDLFEGYYFGTRLSGGYSGICRLHSHGRDELLSATVSHFVGQASRIFQSEQQAAAERDRQITTLNGIRDRLDEHEMPKHARAVHDAARDLLEFGRIRDETTYKLVELGMWTEVPA